MVLNLEKKTMNSKVRLVHLLVLLTCGGVHGIEKCDDEVPDPVEMASAGIYATVSQDAVVSKEVEDQLEKGMVEGGDTLKAFAKSMMDFQDEVRRGAATVDVDDETNSDYQEIRFTVYLCPYVWYFTREVDWFYTYNGAKCWSFYPVAVTNCLTNYCGVSSTIPVWSVRFKCYPRNRIQYLFARCRRDSDGHWFNENIPAVLPRGCNCRRPITWGLGYENKCQIRPNK